jgi:hypothetical protein
LKVKITCNEANRNAFRNCHFTTDREVDETLDYEETKTGLEDLCLQISDNGVLVVVVMMMMMMMIFGKIKVFVILTLSGVNRKLMSVGLFPFWKEFLNNLV